VPLSEHEPEIAICCGFAPRPLWRKGLYAKAESVISYGSPKSDARRR